MRDAESHARRRREREEGEEGGGNTLAICLATSLGNGSTPFAVKGKQAGRLADSSAARKAEDEGCGN